MWNTLVRHGPFRRLWIGRSLSGLGSQMTLVAVMFQIWQSTHSTIWTGAVGLAQALPLIRQLVNAAADWGGKWAIS